MARTDERFQVVLSTAGSGEQARAIAGALVRRRLAACVNVLPGALSVYRWKGEIQEEEETLLVIKSARRLFPALREAIRELHSYEVPEILALSVEEGDPAYLGWLTDCLGEED
jgi:periplasmic divalent cation tolerance protein